MAIEIEGDIGYGYLDDDFRPLLRKLRYGEFRHLLRMWMLVRVCVDQRDVLIRAGSILQGTIKENSWIIFFFLANKLNTENDTDEMQRKSEIFKNLQSKLAKLCCCILQVERNNTLAAILCVKQQLENISEYRRFLEMSEAFQVAYCSEHVHDMLREWLLEKSARVEENIRSNV